MTLQPPQLSGDVRHLQVVRDLPEPSLPQATIDLLLVVGSALDHLLGEYGHLFPEYQADTLRSARETCGEMAAAYLP